MPIEGESNVHGWMCWKCRRAIGSFSETAQHEQICSIWDSVEEWGDPVPVSAPNPTPASQPALTPDPPTFSQAELRLVASLLDLAAEKFSNHGCNDFNIQEALSNPEDLKAIEAEIRRHYGDPDYELGIWTQDHLLMSIYADRLRLAAKSMPEGD